MSLQTVSSVLPPHNLFGDHGPRCRACSGLGHVLRLPSEGGRATRSTSRCFCDGTGVDKETVLAGQMSGLVSRIDTLERKLAREAERRRRIESRITHGGKMSRQTWEELIAWATADGTAIASTTTEAVIFPNVTLPANYMADGRALRITASGKLSTTATPTMIWALRWNGVGGTLIATTEAITMGSGVTNVNWRLQGELQTRLNGSSGSLLFMGTLTVHNAATTVLENVFSVSGYDAPAAVTLDLTADTPLSITADWSANSASNTLTGMMYYIESMN